MTNKDIISDIIWTLRYQYVGWYTELYHLEYLSFFDNTKKSFKEN